MQSDDNIMKMEPKRRSWLEEAFGICSGDVNIHAKKEHVKAMGDKMFMMAQGIEAMKKSLMHSTQVIEKLSQENDKLKKGQMILTADKSLVGPNGQRLSPR